MLGSDWDAEELSPFQKIQSVLTREVEGIPDLATAIRMMTSEVAYLLHQEDRTGTLEPGKLADLIVLDRHIFDISAAQIAETQVLATVLGGKVVYDPGNILIDGN